MRPVRAGGTPGGAGVVPQAPAPARRAVSPQSAHRHPHGPADLYVVELDSASLPGGVTAFLRDGTTVGVITLLDVVLVRRTADGSRHVVEMDEIADELELAGVLPCAPGSIRRDDLLDQADALPDGSAWLVMLMENTWARRLMTAVEDAHAQLVDVERFARVL